MKNLFSSPASMSVVYTIEHVSTVPLRHWHAFVLAVTETFWQLPVRLRPGNTYLPSLNRAADLFPVADVMAFCGDTGGSVWPVNMTIERERNRNTLSIQELDFQHQPCDFFARIVMVLLHNLCPGRRPGIITGLKCSKTSSAAASSRWKTGFTSVKRRRKSICV